MKEKQCCLIIHVCYFEGFFLYAAFIIGMDGCTLLVPKWQFGLIWTTSAYYLLLPGYLKL